MCERGENCQPVYREFHPEEGDERRMGRAALFRLYYRLIPARVALLRKKKSKPHVRTFSSSCAHASAAAGTRERGIGLRIRGRKERRRSRALPAAPNGHARIY